MTPAKGPGQVTGEAHAVSPRAGRIGEGWRGAAREFAIIVAGVLAALGAQALWEGHQEREIERAYLQQVLADARENEERLLSAIAEDSVTVLVGALLLSVLERAAPAPASDTIMAWLNLFGRSAEFQAVTGSLRALLETGDLRLVRDAALRRALTRYATSLDRETERLEQLRGAVLAGVPDLARALPFMRLVFSAGPDVERLNVGELQRTGDASVAIFTYQAAAVNRINGLRRLHSETQRVIAELQAYPRLR